VRSKADTSQLNLPHGDDTGAKSTRRRNVIGATLYVTVVTVTTTFSKWNLQFFKQFSVSYKYQFFLILWARVSYFSYYQKRSVA